jgi:hypothetical protein
MGVRDADLRAICDLFPKLRHAFAYGSGFYAQPGLYDGHHAAQEKALLDFIFVVENPTLWHREVRVAQIHTM